MSAKRCVEAFVGIDAEGRYVAVALGDIIDSSDPRYAAKPDAFENATPPRKKATAKKR
jgi:hypothetical protein